MDIPKLMTGFSEDGRSLLESKVKYLSIKEKDKKKQLINVFMDFNLDKQCIEFDLEPYYEESEEKYLFLQKDSSSGLQNYVTRDIDGAVYYWKYKKGPIISNLYNEIADGKLKNLLELILNSSFYDHDNPKVSSMVQLSGTKYENVEFNNKTGKFESNGLSVKFENLVKTAINSSDNVKICLIIPRIIYNHECIVISKEEDYLNFVLSRIQAKGTGHKGVCHICGQLKNDINTEEYSPKLLDCLCKVFVTTTINYAPSFDAEKYETNFSICKDCFEKIYISKNKIMHDNYIKIANENCVVLFEGILNTLDKKYIEELRGNINYAFNPNKIEKWIKLFEEELRVQDNNFYEFNLVFYRVEKNKFIIIKSIENVSNIVFKSINNTFEDVRKSLNEYLNVFTIGSLYSMIPITKKDGKQLNIKVLLDLYGAILDGEMISKGYTFDLACEALDKGVIQLKSKKIRNENLADITWLCNKDNGQDYYISRIIFRYIALFKVLNKLNLLDKEVFKVNTQETISDNLTEYIGKSEEFLIQQGFSTQARGLFYLGMMLYNIGVAQYNQQHPTKPILDKITYSGMTNNDVMTLYTEILEKNRQYVKYLNLYIQEQLLKQLHKYLGDLTEVKLFTEKENVFYIMAGYAYCVGGAKKITNEINPIESDGEKENEND